LKPTFIKRPNPIQNCRQSHTAATARPKSPARRITPRTFACRECSTRKFSAARTRRDAEKRGHCAAKAIAEFSDQDGDFVAVLHEFPDVAEVALGKIKAEFETPAATYDDKTVFDHLISVAPEPRVSKQGGDLDEGRKSAAKKFEQTYLNSYVAHSPMEPHAAMCQIEGDKATVWLRRKIHSARAAILRGGLDFRRKSPRHHTGLSAAGSAGKQQPGAR